MKFFPTVSCQNLRIGQNICKEYLIIDTKAQANIVYNPDQ